MSNRDDIDLRLVYSCNCGWIDKGHASIGRLFRKRDVDPRAGAFNLWDQIKNESNSTQDTINGQPCFRVIYKQSMARKVGVNSPFKFLALPDRSLFKVSTVGYYLVKKGLSITRKEEIALRIFLDISYNFEKMQASFPFFLATNSGYSQEDLVSNVIGFYAAVRNMSDNLIEHQLCKVVSKQASLDVWDKHFKKGGIGALKSKDHTKPVFYPCTECRGNPSFPPMFTSIKRAQYGSDFLRYESDPTRSGVLVRNFDSEGVVIK